MGQGFFIEPTAALAATNESKVAQQEIFGPFATFIKFSSVEEAIAIANDSEYGLVSYVWSDHLPTVTVASELLKSGVVWINTPMMRELRAPFGGVKSSGVGREGGEACERFYTEEKTISMPRSPISLRKIGQEKSSL